MRRNCLIRIAAVTLFLFSGSVYAQVRKPAPTGQVPKSYSGQQRSPYSEYKPRPTGQITPAEGAIPQQTTNQTNGVSQLPGTASQQRMEGQVPKVNSNQDARTFPERYNPNPVTQSESVITTKEIQTQPGQTQSVITDQVIQTDVTTPVEQGNANTTTTTATSGSRQPATQQQNTNSRSTNQTQTNTQQRTTTQPRAATTGPAIPASPQRLQPNF